MGRTRNAGRHSAKAIIRRNDGVILGTLRAFGKSAKAAASSAKRIMGQQGIPAKRNVAAGFVDGSGVFHPIRASYDYSEKRAGEWPLKHYRPARPVRRKPKKKTAKRKRNKTLNFGERMARARRRAKRSRR